MVMIVGTGGFAAQLYSDCLDSGVEGIVGFVDNVTDKTTYYGLPVFKYEDIGPNALLINGVATLDIRRKLVAELPNYTFQSLLLGNVSRFAKLGVATITVPTSTLMANATLGNHCILNFNTYVAHDCVVGDFCTLAPYAGICGHATTGNNVSLGVNSTILPRVHVCDDVIIGAAACVTKHITEPGTYVGIPARKI